MLFLTRHDGGVYGSGSSSATEGGACVSSWAANGVASETASRTGQGDGHCRAYPIGPIETEFNGHRSGEGAGRGADYGVVGVARASVNRNAGRVASGSS